MPKIEVVNEMGEQHVISNEEMYFDKPKMIHILIDSDIVS